MENPKAQRSEKLENNCKLSLLHMLNSKLEHHCAKIACLFEIMKPITVHGNF